MKHSYKLIKILLFFWIVMLPVATVIDSMMFESPAYRNFVSYGIPTNVFYAFLFQNIHELFIFTMGMLLSYLLYRKDVYGGGYVSMICSFRKLFKRDKDEEEETKSVDSEGHNSSDAMADKQTQGDNE